MEFEEYIAKCVVKILSPNGKEIDGTGFWVLADGYCLTCYHIIKSRDPKSINIEYNNKVLQSYLDLSLSNPDKDIAILKLTSKDIPLIYYAPLDVAEMDVDVRIHGYREGFPKAYTVTGKLRPGQDFGKVGLVYNLETNQPEKSSVRGMSGAPVFDPRREVVVGIQYGEEEAGPTITYVHPIEKVYESWPELREKNRLIIDREPKPGLLVEWTSCLMILESKTFWEGDPIEGCISPREKEVRLTLQNASKRVATNLVVQLKNNWNAFVEPSDSFSGPSGQLKNSITLRAKQGVDLYGLPDGFDYSNDALNATSLFLGTVQWDQNEGGCWLWVTVSAKEILKPVHFEIYLELK